MARNRLARGYYWGRNRGGRLIGAEVTPGPGVDGTPSIMIAPITSKTGQPTCACWIEITVPMATRLVDDLNKQITRTGTVASHSEPKPN